VQVAYAIFAVPDRHNTGDDGCQQQPVLWLPPFLTPCVCLLYCCHRGVVGEIRERSLQQLPPACMYMGRTSLSLEDIRQYNAAQGRQTYTLHENDCRWVGLAGNGATMMSCAAAPDDRHVIVMAHCC